MGVFIQSYNLTGLIIGMAAFLIIALGRYTTIAAEYHFGKGFWKGFLIIGIAALILSLYIDSFVLSSIFSILGFTYLWGIGEIIEQEKRVRRGWYPENPGRKRRER